MVPIDDVVHFDVITRGSSGVVDADSTPTFAVYEEDTDTAILAAQNFTKRTSLTGNYRGSITASVANGFEAGKWYNVIASATVSSVTDKCVALTFRVAPAESTAGVNKVDVGYVNGSATAASVIALLHNAGVQIGTVNDAGATTTGFVVTITTKNPVNSHLDGFILLFTSGALLGEARGITSNGSSSGADTTLAFSGSAGDIDEAWDSAPANGVSFIILGRWGN